MGKKNPDWTCDIGYLTAGTVLTIAEIMGMAKFP
jgi:hypothetical protein